MTHRNLTNAGLILTLILASSGRTVAAPLERDRNNDADLSRNSQQPLVWESPAKLRHTVHKEKGQILIGPGGIEFRAGKGRALKWSFLDVQTFFLSPHRLVIKTYKDRAHRLPGVQRYRFDLTQAVPYGVAAGLAREVQRPSQNAVPDPASPSVTNISAHHRTRTGGTNGTLRFRKEGIDYVTSVSGDSRSWRWADLETLSKPDPYHLFVFGYRDTYTFDLKEPLSRALFNRLTDEIWAYQENETRGGHVSLPPGALANGERSEKDE